MNRRQQDRWPLGCNAAAMQLDGDRFGRMHELWVFDCGLGGMGAFSEDPISHDTMLTVSFDHDGYRPVHGRVVLCNPYGAGHRISVEFAQRLAA